MLLRMLIFIISKSKHCPSQLMASTIAVNLITELILLIIFLTESQWLYHAFCQSHSASQELHSLARLWPKSFLRTDLMSSTSRWRLNDDEADEAGNEDAACQVNGFFQFVPPTTSSLIIIFFIYFMTDWLAGEQMTFHLSSSPSSSPPMPDTIATGEDDNSHADHLEKSSPLEPEHA